MKLSKRSRYGTRLLLDMARHYQEGPVQLSVIARRQAISVKFLEQIIIPLKKANYVRSVRGAKGGHMLAKAPDQVTVGEVIELLEEGLWIAECTEKPETCDRSPTCPTRLLWKEATEALYARLRATTFADLLKKGGDEQETECPSVAKNADDETE
jgi:Rrf2 family protein